MIFLGSKAIMEWMLMKSFENWICRQVIGTEIACSVLLPVVAIWKLCPPVLSWIPWMFPTTLWNLQFFEAIQQDQASGIADKKMVMFAAPCNALHIATKLRFSSCAMCYVHSYPFPGHLDPITGPNLVQTCLHRAICPYEENPEILLSH